MSDRYAIYCEMTCDVKDDYNAWDRRMKRVSEQATHVCQEEKLHILMTMITNESDILCERERREKICASEKKN